MDCMYAARTALRLLHAVAVDSDVAFTPVKTEPSPRSFQSTIFGSGAHGVWLDSSTSVAISGGCGLSRSSPRDAPRVNRSGTARKLNHRPRHPRTRAGDRPLARGKEPSRPAPALRAGSA